MFWRSGGSRAYQEFKDGSRGGSQSRRLLCSPTGAKAACIVLAASRPATGTRMGKFRDHPSRTQPRITREGPASAPIRRPHHGGNAAPAGLRLGEEAQFWGLKVWRASQDQAKGGEGRYSPPWQLEASQSCNEGYSGAAARTPIDLAPGGGPRRSVRGGRLVSRTLTQFRRISERVRVLRTVALVYFPRLILQNRGQA